MTQIQKDSRIAILLNGTWLLLLVEHICFNLVGALPLACIWGVFTMLANIRIISRYAVSIEYK